MDGPFLAPVAGLWVEIGWAGMGGLGLGWGGVRYGVRYRVRKPGRKPVSTTMMLSERTNGWSIPRTGRRLVIGWAGGGRVRELAQHRARCGVQLSLETWATRPRCWCLPGRGPGGEERVSLGSLCLVRVNRCAGRLGRRSEEGVRRAGARLGRGLGQCTRR